MTNTNYKFSGKPGAYERHFMRAAQFPQLFADFDLSHAQLLLDRQQDQQEAEEFQQQLLQLVQKVIDLEQQTDSQVLLDIKAELEQAYTYAASLGGDQQANKQAMEKLINTIISTIENNIDAGDTLAKKELEMEKQARTIHFNMLQNPLIADLLREQPPFEQQQLIAILLAEQEESCMQCLSLFEEEQIASLIEQGIALHKELAAQELWLPQFQTNLDNMGKILAQALPETSH